MTSDSSSREKPNKPFDSEASSQGYAQTQDPDASLLESEISTTLYYPTSSKNRRVGYKRPRMVTSIRVNRKLWEAFKKASHEDGVKTCNNLEALITLYLDARKNRPNGATQEFVHTTIHIEKFQVQRYVTQKGRVFPNVDLPREVHGDEGHCCVPDCDRPVSQSITKTDKASLRQTEEFLCRVHFLQRQIVHKRRARREGRRLPYIWSYRDLRR